MTHDELLTCTCICGAVTGEYCGIPNAIHYCDNCETYCKTHGWYKPKIKSCACWKNASEVIKGEL